MRDAQIVKPRKGEVVEEITTFQVKDVPKVKANPIRLSPDRGHHLEIGKGCEESSGYSTPGHGHQKVRSQQRS